MENTVFIPSADLSTHTSENMEGPIGLSHSQANIHAKYGSTNTHAIILKHWNSLGTYIAEIFEATQSAYFYGLRQRGSLFH
jgi:hypothetical protein